MTDEAALRRTCYYAPDDDAPRLVLCDWLEERGQLAEASLIRRMVYAPSYTFTWNRRSQHGSHTHAETRRAITGLKGTIETLYRDHWQRLPGVERITVRRGFIESILTSASTFLDHASPFFGWHPITTVHLCLRFAKPR